MNSGKMENGQRLHTGTVVSVSEDSYLIALDGVSDCGQCPAASLCRKEGSDRISVPCGSCKAILEPGNKVAVEMANAATWAAIMYCLALPLLVLAGSVVGVYALTANGILSCAVSLGVLAAYFAVLARFKRYFLRKYQFNVTKINCMAEAESEFVQRFC